MCGAMNMLKKVSWYIQIPAWPSQQPGKVEVIDVESPVDGTSTDVECCLCGVRQSDEERLEMHVSADHLDWLPFVCTHCFGHFPSESALRQHLHNAHPTLPTVLTYKADDVKQAELRRLMQQSIHKKKFPLNASLSTPSSQPFPWMSTPHAARQGFVQPPNCNGSAQLSPITRSTNQSEAVALQQPISAVKSTAASSCVKLEEDCIENLPPEIVSTAKSTDCQARLEVERVSGGNSGKGRLCKLCSANCAGMFTRHVWNNHMSVPAAACFHCPFTAKDFHVMRKHVLLHHPAVDKDDFHDKRQELMPEFRKAYESCFGCKPQNGNGQIKAVTNKSLATGVHNCRECGVQVLRHKRRHVWRNHVEQNAARCNHCDFETKTAEQMKRHLSSKHSNLARTFTDKRVELYVQHQQAFKKCFGEGSSTMDKETFPNNKQDSHEEDCEDSPSPDVQEDRPVGTKRPHSPVEAAAAKGEAAADADTVANGNGSASASRECQLCNDQVNVNPGSLNYHVWRRHMEEMALSCPHCDYPKHNTLNNNSVVLAHMKKQHPGKKGRVIDRRHELKAKVVALQAECFPTHSEACEPAAKTMRLSDEAVSSLQKCNLCKATLHESVLDHLFRVHIGQARFECQWCEFTTRWSEETMQAHLTNGHPTTDEPIQSDHYFDLQDRYAKEVADFTLRCFGTNKQESSSEAVCASEPAKKQKEVAQGTDDQWCAVCFNAVGKRQLAAHVYKHLSNERDKPRFRCGGRDCHLSGTGKGPMNIHIASKHAAEMAAAGKSTNELLIDCADELTTDFSDQWKLCFPSC